MKRGIRIMLTSPRAHGILVATLAALLVAAPSRAAGVSVSLGASPVSVSPGAEFDLDLQVTVADAAFNGFDAVISYDPSVLTFMPASPTTLQQGCLMTGGCSGACGGTFHTFAAAADSLDIVDVLLCDQFSLTGPGQLYRLHFKATAIPQTTHVRIRRAGFYDAGLIVSPVTTTDVDVEIGGTSGVGDGRVSEGLALHASPEPARGPVQLVIRATEAGTQTLEVHDITGRRVRRLAGGWEPAGVRTLTWDGRDDGGATLPSGVYLAVVRAGERVARVRVTLLR
ncbi:MAG: FlgD immunoglobulin-like domain containing protein [Candidatus Eisenbacteria bacterium]